MATTYDVAVIGAGVFGAWSAHLLQRSSAKVVLVDQYGPGNSRSSSGGESRIIRMGYGADEVYTRFSMRSLPMWKELFAEAGRPHLFHKTGVLWIAPDKYQYAIDSLATLHANGVGCEQLTVRDLRRRYPQISFEDDAWGIFEPHSGVLMARRAVRAIVDQAIATGVEYRSFGVVKPSGKQKLETISSSTGEKITAGTFVFACGSWLPKLFPDLMASRMFVTRQEILFFGVPPGDRL